MIEKDKDIRETIKEVSFNLISELAPEEAEMFHEISDAYFNNPELLSGLNSKDDPVGFGVDGIIEMVSPATLGVVTTVITYIATEAFGAAKGALTDELKSKIKSLFNKKTGEKASHVHTLTKEQLKLIRDKAISEGKAQKLSEEKATNLANALISSMVLN
jgi:hypothetical protein